MFDDKYGVLIHGAGWVSTQHIAAYKANRRTRVVAVSSRNEQSARRRVNEAGLEGVATYGTLTQALDHPDVDIVSICTPQHLHCDNVIAAAHREKHLVIEKPVAISLQELQKMTVAVQKSGVKSVVSFVLRWNPLFCKLKYLIAEGRIGKPYYVEADYLSYNGNWWSGWNDARTIEHGVSAMLVGGCHAVDALRWFACEQEFTAARPTSVVALRGGYRKGSTQSYNPIDHTWQDGTPPMEYEGLEVGLVTFDNGVIGKISVNADCIMPYRFPIRIYGDAGTIVDNQIWSPSSGSAEWTTIDATRPDSSDVSHHPFQGQIDHFVDCVAQDKESHCNLVDAALTHKVVFAALASYETHDRIAIN